MVVLRALRQSPSYLYVKAYCLCTLVTLFKATPVSSTLTLVRAQLDTEKKKRRAIPNGGPRLVTIDDHGGSLVSRRTSTQSSASLSPSLDPASKSRSTIGKKSYLGRISKRWHKRALDLAQINFLLRRDEQDLMTYPEMEWDATVRCSSSLHPEEGKFIALRRQRISSEGQNSLHDFLELPADDVVDPRDVPLVALGGSGGGYRAMFGFAAFISACKKSQLWDCITWAAGVSGSCWTLGAYYTIARHDATRLMQHYISMAKELMHPMSISAMDKVVRSTRGVYFLIGPLVRKAQSCIIGLGIMDLYATLITTYQFLSRKPGASLSRATFQLSKMWTRSGIDKGAEPMPIFTAVRRAPRDSFGVKANRDSSISKGRPPEVSMAQHHSDYLEFSMPRRRESEPPRNGPSKGLFQWFEISPLEVGCRDLQRFVPTWAWGRTFSSGHSVDRRPEQSLALLLGQCTSAPAGPLTGYVSALLASLPTGTIMSRVLFALNRFITMKKWERIWANPIRAGHDPNPFYGTGMGPALEMAHMRSSRPSKPSIGKSEFDSSSLIETATRSNGKSLENLALSILSQKEWDELNRLVTGLHNSVQSWQSTARYLSVAWAAKSAASMALNPLYSVPWKHLSVNFSTLSPLINAPSSDAAAPAHLGFSPEFLKTYRDTVPRLNLNISWRGTKVTANVKAERYSTLHGRETSAGDDCAISKKNSKEHQWEAQGRLRLMDGGMSNNLPNHVLSRPERGADMIIAFDASSDVHTDAAIRRIKAFANDCNIYLEDQTESFQPPFWCHSAGSGATSASSDVESRYLHHYARVFGGSRQNGQKIYLVYCPLLPNPINPEFNPSRETFSTSYNLVWTPDQVNAVFQTSEANLSDYGLHTIKQVMKKIYMSKKTDRLIAETSNGRWISQDRKTR
ncbi:acyl transferase/acyl hydrolase/lysophospholipase [Dactylonectria macrodidyma]|uniref:Lysophospholipase n=1 Tax=Dactylonectria macrodidyma TaxID=307937 RepID=A0A9P9FSP9_9HYPO|nr:acyl transferase/acyl hydrolase/lysophospholipase [Dactylonectria macrodidyma]